MTRDILKVVLQENKTNKNSIVASSWHNVANEKFDKLLEGKFGADLPRIDELEQRTALAFVNTNPAMDYKISLPENVIAVGGMHIKNNTKPLPKVNKANQQI